MKIQEFEQNLLKTVKFESCQKYLQAIFFVLHRFKTVSFRPTHKMTIKQAPKHKINKIEVPTQ